MDTSDPKSEVSRSSWEEQSYPAKPDRRPKNAPVAVSLSGRVQNEMVAMLGEFVGTFMFLVFAYGATTAVNIAPAVPGGFLGSDPSRLLFISLAFGLSLAVNAVCLPLPGSFSPTATFARIRLTIYPVIVGILPNQWWSL